MPATRRPEIKVVKADYYRLSTAEMAKKHGVSERTILDWVYHYGLPVKKKQLPLQLVGVKIGHWTVVRDTGERRSGAIVWLLRCQCGNEGTMTSGAIREGRSLSCGCLRRTGVGELSGKYWASILRRAKRLQRPVSMTIQEAWALYLQQDRKCALSSLPIAFKNNTASLDRIDSTLGYTMDNTQWVHKEVNLMKNVLPQQHFLELCRAITQTHPR